MEILFGIEHLPTLERAVTVAFDVETTGLQPTFGGMRLLQLCTLGQMPVVIDCWQLDDNDWIVLEEFFNVERTWLAHNAVFDLAWLQEYEIHPAGNVLCTMLGSRILTNGLPNLKHGLQYVVKRYLRYDISKEQQKSDWSGDLTPEQIEYAAKDVVVLTQLHKPIQQRMAVENLTGAWMLECFALPAMAQLWRTGLPFNKESLIKLIEDLDVEHKEVGERFIADFDAALPEGFKLHRDEFGNLKYQTRSDKKVKLDPEVFNLNSPAQLLVKFSALLSKAPIDNKTGRASASKPALQEYVGEHKCIADYLRWKRVEKRRQMAETLEKNVANDGFIRASYLQLGADTGRMSCMSPNLQQIPRDVRFRACVQAPPGWKFVVADYSGMEMRLAAAEAEDPLMTQAFQEGKDLHTITAMQIYGVAEDEVTKEQRQIAKSANFGLLYGSGAKGLRNYAATMGIQMELEEAGEIRQKFHAAYKGIYQWQRDAASAAVNRGHDNGEVRIRVSGMRRILPGDYNRLTTRCNTPIQGAGAAVLKRTLGKLWPLLKADGEDVVRLAGVVHDEVILLVAEEHADAWALQLQSVMEDAEAQWLGDIPALAEAKVGDSWDKAK